GTGLALSLFPGRSPGARHPDRQSVRGLHVRIPKGVRIAQILERHVEGVVPPEELVTDHERRHTEYAARACPVGIVAQALFDRRIAEHRLRVRDAQLTS